MSLFDWDEANTMHIHLHNVTANEAEQAMLGASIDLDTYVVDGEVRYENVGETKTGRILKVISVDRNGLIRVVTAFDAAADAKKIYLRALVRP